MLADSDCSTKTSDGKSSSRHTPERPSLKWVRANLLAYLADPELPIWESAVSLALVATLGIDAAYPDSTTDHSPGPARAATSSCFPHEIRFTEAEVLAHVFRIHESIRFIQETRKFALERGEEIASLRAQLENDPRSRGLARRAGVFSAAAIRFKQLNVSSHQPDAAVQEAYSALAAVPSLPKIQASDPMLDPLAPTPEDHPQADPQEQIAEDLLAPEEHLAFGFPVAIPIPFDGIAIRRLPLFFAVVHIVEEN